MPKRSGVRIPPAQPINTVRVLCNGKTSAFQADDTGSIPVTRSKISGPRTKLGEALPVADESLLSERIKSEAARLTVPGGKSKGRILEDPELTSHSLCCRSSEVEHFLGKEKVVSSSLIDSTSSRFIGRRNRIPAKGDRPPKHPRPR